MLKLFEIPQKFIAKILKINPMLWNWNVCQNFDLVQNVLVPYIITSNRKYQLIH